MQDRTYYANKHKQLTLWFFLWKMSSMIVDYVKNMTQALHFKHRKLKVKVNISKLYQNCNGHAVPKK